MTRPARATVRPTLAVLTALALALTLVACGADGDRTGIVVTPGMHFSTPIDGYSPNPTQPTRFGQMLPPEGTRPYGAPAVPHFTPGAEEAKRAGAELQMPIDATDASLTRGKVLFDSFCSVCHGDGGEGDGPIIGRYPNPPSLLANHAKGLPDGQLWHIITHGQGIMPPYKYQVRPEDRWKLIQYVRQEIMGMTVAAPPADSVAAPPADSNGGGK